MKCKKCGNEIGSGHIACMYCGALVDFSDEARELEQARAELVRVLRAIRWQKHLELTGGIPWERPNLATPKFADEPAFKPKELPPRQFQRPYDVNSWLYRAPSKGDPEAAKRIEKEIQEFEERRRISERKYKLKLMYRILLLVSVFIILFVSFLFLKNK